MRKNPNDMQRERHILCKKRYKGLRWVVCAILCILLPVFCSGCGSPSENPMAGIYYDDEKLASNYSSYSLEDAEQVIDGRSMTGTFRGLNGMVMFWTCEPDEDTVADIRYLLRVTGGKVKLIFVDGKNRIETLAELTKHTQMEEAETVTLSVRDGYNRLKLVGTEDAVVSFEISASKSSFISVRD